MLQAGILFILLTAHLIISVPANATQTFEQAYAPIDVSGITIFIPIDRQPSVPPQLSIKHDGDKYLLNWSSNDATYYQLESLVDGAWISIANNIPTNQYTASLEYGDKFRVSACDRYGCSNWREVNNYIHTQLMINRFSKSSDGVAVGNTVLLSWDVDSSININISSNQGHRFSTYINQGQQKFSVNKLTEFTLTASSFIETHTQKLMVAPAFKAPDFRIVPSEDNYLQPLLEHVKSQNKNMLPIERALLSLSLANGTKLNIVPQQDNKLSRVSDTGVEQWTINLSGVLANKPVFKANQDGVSGYLYFNLSAVNGSGQLCKIQIDGTDIQCLTTKPNTSQKLINIIAAPLLVDDRMFSISLHGHLYEVSTEFSPETYRYHGQVPLNFKDVILTSPVIDKNSNKLIIRTKLDNIIAIDMPSSQGILNSIIRKAKSFYSVVNTSSSSSEVIDIKWSKALIQGKDK
jgi:hypothetical protein